jgi:ADP-heptose:LPS heptosyltransferase
MAHKSATFASDVGFPRQTDYSLAARLQSKDFRNHELLNLLSLGHWISGNLVLEIPDFIVDADYFLKLNPVLAAWPAKSYFVLQVGAGLPTKEWPLDRSLALGQRISAYFDMPCAIIGDAAWAERVSYEAENHGLKRYFNLCGKTSVSQLIALLNGAQILIGPCSGPKHLAMALRVPTFTLYGPSEPERWGAFFDRDSHGSIRSPLRLSPREMREYPVNATMLALEVETVSEAAIQFMRSLVGKKMLD